MKTLKVIPLLDSIPKVDSFSNIGHNLEKLFKMNSLKNLIRTLKFKNEFHKQITSESSNLIKVNEEYDVFEREKNIKKIIEEDQIDIFSLPISQSEPKLQLKKHHIKSFLFHRKNKDELDTNFLAYKYNPNFNSIYKNTPTVKILKSKTENKKKKNNLFNREIKNNFSGNNSIQNIKKRNKEHNKEYNFYNKNKYLNTINSYKNFNYQKNLKNKTLRYRNNTQNTIINSNSKSLKSVDSINRFITEISIKPIKKTQNNKNSKDILPDLLTPKLEEKNTSSNSIEKSNEKVITPFHFKNRAIDFTKMRSRKAFNFKNSLHIPNFGYYEPKYNLVEKRQYNIFFNKKPEFNKHRQKKILLQKILTSYDVEPMYQTIDNKKLNNDILKKYKLIK